VLVLQNRGMSYQHSMESSPIDYEAIRASLDFSGLTPQNAAVVDSPTGQSQPYEPIICEFPAEYSHGVQVLRLPPCSPARPSPISEETYQREFRLIEYPAPLLDDGSAVVPWENRDNADLLSVASPAHADQPTLAEVAHFLHSHLMPVAQHFAVFDSSLRDCRRLYNSLQEATAANAQTCVGQLHELWRTLGQISRETAEMSQENSRDLTNIRDRFNDLVAKHLPEQAAVVQHNLQHVVRECERRFHEQDSRLQELFATAQQHSHSSARLNESFRALADNFRRYDSLMSENSGSLNQRETHCKMLDLMASIAEVRETSRHFQDEIPRTFVTRHEFDAVLDRLNKLEASLTGIPKSRSEWIDTTENILHTLCTDYDDNFERCNEQFAILGKDLRDLRGRLDSQPYPMQHDQALSSTSIPDGGRESQDHYSHGLLHNLELVGSSVRALSDRLQYLDGTVTHIVSRLRDCELGLSAYEKTIIPVQRLQTLEEDIREIANLLPSIEEVKHDCCLLRDRLDCMDKRETSRLAQPPVIPPVMMVRHSAPSAVTTHTQVIPPVQPSLMDQPSSSTEDLRIPAVDHIQSNPNAENSAFSQPHASNSSQLWVRIFVI